MNILYIAKHNSGGNDDEGAIAWALTKLGHSVFPLAENQSGDINHLMKFSTFDMCLFHKWYDLKALRKLTIPKVFWYFDLVDFPDPTLARRNTTRKNWMDDVLPLVDLGFCSDGDWIDKLNSPKLIHLFQGADSRVTGYGYSPNPYSLHILFPGISVGGGKGRMEFVEAMREHYGLRFNQVQGVYRRNLADLIASYRVLVAPNSPVTDRYWSNRVYMLLGFGGLLLHPRCKLLESQYRDGNEIVFYDSLPDLYSKIDYYCDSPLSRERIAGEGLVRTLNEHTYLHRCKTLLGIVEKRLGVK